MAAVRSPQERRRVTAPTQEVLSSAGTSVSVSRSPEVEAKAVILTATQVEYEAVCRHLDPLSIKSCLCDDEQPYDIGEFYANNRLWHIATTQIQPRSSAAASEVGEAINCFGPDIILFVGTAAGVKKKDLKIGYVVVATKAHDVDSGYETDKGFVPEPQEALSHKLAIWIAKRCIKEKTWKKRIKGEIHNNEPEARTGSVATTSKTVKSKESPTCEIIKLHYGGVLALEQEGFGFLTAANRRKKCAIVIRGIADFVKDKDEDEAKGSKDCAMMNATAFAFELIANFSET